MERARKWNQLKDVALSICDDYMPEVRREIGRLNRMHKLQSQRESDDVVHHEPGDQVDLVDRNGRVRMKPQRSEVEKQVHGVQHKNTTKASKQDMGEPWQRC